jgi:hypothetical protein
MGFGAFGVFFLLSVAVAFHLVLLVIFFSVTNFLYVFRLQPLISHAAAGNWEDRRPRMRLLVIW